MKSRQIHLSLLLVVLVLAVSVFASCQGNEPKEHEHAAVIDAAVDATCEETGLTEGEHCSLCGEVLKAQNEIPAKGHTAGAEATCTAAQECTVCHAELASAKGHAAGVEATCTAAQECTVCHAELTPAKGHSPEKTALCTDTAACTVCGTALSAGNHTAGAAATCTTAQECTVCHAELTPAKGHGSVLFATCTAAKTCDGCGIELQPALGHTPGPAATCTNAQECTVCYTMLALKKEHTWSAPSVTCRSGRECTVCHLTEDKVDCRYQLIGSTTADCTHDGTKTYECVFCQATYTDTLVPAAGHDLTGAAPVMNLKAGTTCEYVEAYTCRVCGETVEGNTVLRHEYRASVKTEPSCMATGTKTYACIHGDHSYDEVIPVNAEAHTWGASAFAAGAVKTLHCTNGCSAAKTVIDASGETEAVISSDDLKETGEVSLKEADVVLDDATLAQVGSADVTLGAAKLEGAALESAKAGLSDKQKEQLGDNPIYDFTLSAGGQTITQFNGRIKVTLPYTPNAEDDVDNISIWYIDGNGAVQNVDAEYCNGTVTFYTTHFSYYTVTRLTAEERCAISGHNMLDTLYPATCTEGGYTDSVCTRCGFEEKKDVTAAKGHDYLTVTTPAACETDGSELSKCRNCDKKTEVRLPAAGHTVAIDAPVASTCTATGLTEGRHCSVCGKILLAQQTVEKRDHIYNGNGECAVCGHKSDTCDHALTVEEIINFTDFGACAALVQIRRCECGEVVEVVGGEDMTCEFEEPTPEQTVDPDGTVHMFASMSCKKCGLVAHIKMSVKAGDNCQKTQKQEIDFEMNGEHILHFTDDWTYEDHDTKAVRTELTDFGACGGYVVRQTCRNCETVTDTGFEIRCLSLEFVTYDITLDQNGKETVHSVSRCRTCGLEHENLSWYGEPEEDCLIERFTKNRLAIDGEVIAEWQGNWFTSDHELEYSIGEGESCTKPHTRIQSCKKCDYRHEERVLGHMAGEFEGVDIGESACGTHLSVAKCEFCDTVCDVDLGFYCTYNYTMEDIVGEDGKPHTLATFSCVECDLVYTIERWYGEKNENCAALYSRIMTFKRGDEVLYQTYVESFTASHEIETTLIGTCDNGTLRDVCVDCGEEWLYESGGHSDETQEVSLTIGEHLVHVAYEECRYCGQIAGMNVNYDECNIAWQHNQVTDKDGAVRDVWHGTCEDCGFDYYREDWEGPEADGVCIVDVFGYRLLKDGAGNILFERNLQTVGENHDYEYKITSGNCYEGTYTATCRTCGDSFRGNCHGHVAEENTLTFGEGEHKIEVRCDVCWLCGKPDYIMPSYHGCTLEEDVTVEEDADGVTYANIVRTCEDCGLVYTIKTWTTLPDEKCQAMRYEHHTVAYGGEVVFDNTSENRQTVHRYTYELLQGTCETEGIVKETCSLCGRSNKIVTKGHNTSHEKYSISLGDHVVEGSKMTCLYCGELVYLDVSVPHCTTRWNHYETTDEDGVLHTFQERTCSDCGLYYLKEMWTGEAITDCLAVRYEKYTVKNAEGTVLVEGTRTGRIETHDYIWTVLSGSCESESKVERTCENCDYKEVYSYMGHDMDCRVIDLTEYGVCAGKIETYPCRLCGETVQHDVTLPDDGCELIHEYSTETNADGAVRTINNWACLVCGFEMVQDHFSCEMGDGQILIENTYIAFANGVEIYNSTTRSYR